MKVVKRNLHLKKISVVKHKEIESEERIKKIQGREKKLIVSKLWKSQNENCFF